MTITLFLTRCALTALLTEAGRLFDAISADGDNVLALKESYWIGVR